jgi:hypothetical protein
VEPRRIPGAAADVEDEVGALAENGCGLGKGGVGGLVRLIRDQRGDQPFAPGRDILPMEEALPLLAFLAVDPALADCQQPRQPRPGGAVLRPHQQ